MEEEKNLLAGIAGQAVSANSRKIGLQVLVASRYFGEKTTPDRAGATGLRRCDLCQKMYGS